MDKETNLSQNSPVGTQTQSQNPDLNGTQSQHLSQANSQQLTQSPPLSPTLTQSQSQNTQSQHLSQNSPTSNLTDEEVKSLQKKKKKKINFIFN